MFIHRCSRIFKLIFSAGILLLCTMFLVELYSAHNLIGWSKKYDTQARNITWLYGEGLDQNTVASQERVTPQRDHTVKLIAQGPPTTKVSPYGETSCRDNPWSQTLALLLKAWLYIAKSHNIQYVLFTGTLLGAIRNNDIIPWDIDMDLLVDVRYYQILKALSVKRGFNMTDNKIRLVLQPDFMKKVDVDERRRYSCEGEEVSSQVDQCSFQEPLGRLIKGHLHIDLYHFTDKGRYIEDNQEDDPKKYRKEDFYPLKPCRFMGMTAMCPNKPEKLLKRYFKTDKLSSPYLCRGGKWFNRKGKEIDPF